MKRIKRACLIAIWSLLAVCILCWLDSHPQSFAQYRIRRKVPKTLPKNAVKKLTPTPTPVLLPQVAAELTLRLAPSSIPLLFESPTPIFESGITPPPPPVTGIFFFETATYDKNGNLTLSSKRTAKFYREYIADGVWIELVEIPSGDFTMGAPPNEISSENSERPQHKVIVPQFWIGKYEVTQGQWRAVAKLPKVNLNLKPISDLNLDPSYFKGDDNLPVEQVTWDEAVEFCARLAMKTGKPYRLPTEAEWEYAARAGTKTPFAFGETITPKIVNYNGNYPYTNRYPIGENREKTVPVGSLGVANAFGIFDMQGNVREWCLDRWHDSYKNGAPTDGSAWESGERDRVSRGGSWDGDANDSRSAARITYNYQYIRPKGQGFRIVVR
ncbi:MAG: SUMF1/EgtB/PvdO family nonheme iron enzyme [Acidobacteria bacterium]|nr:SUMF1/EgtB/PvdO family nonheme iron enzyme [Acidobacteriota bacterium]